jgi:DNA-binding NarL/FixJ family response regulator
MGGVEMGRSALDLQRGGIAVLDSAGDVTWTDDAWAAGDCDCGLPHAPMGTNLLEAYRGYSDPRAQAIADAIVAVFEGKVTYFEMEHRPDRESESTFLTSVAALRGDGAGAVVIHKVVGRREPPNRFRLADVRATDGAPIGDGVDRLTPREREVLDLMAEGLDNRAIAAKLSIQYTTVRGHVRSVIEKLGARSRLEAVARAYQGGWLVKS